MCGSALRAESVFTADSGSLKMSAETLFEPMTWDRMERLRSVTVLKVITSYPMNAEDATRRATPLTSMFIHVSLCAMEYSLALNIVNLQTRQIFLRPLPLSEGRKPKPN